LNTAAAPLKPSAPRLWIVRWVRADGLETRHRMFLRRHPAQRFLTMLLDEGRTARMFGTSVCWKEES